MRRLALAVAVSGMLVFAGQHTAAADAPTETIAHGEFTDTNACTGEQDRFFVDIVFRDHFEHPQVFTGIAKRSGYATSGFVMQAGVSQLVENAHIFKLGLSDQWVHPDTGERFHANYIIVFNKNTGRVQVDTWVTLRCLGRGVR